MSIKKLAIMAPWLCDAVNSDRFGTIAGLVFDHELNDKNSVFAENPSSMRYLPFVVLINA